MGLVMSRNLRVIRVQSKLDEMFQGMIDLTDATNDEDKNNKYYTSKYDYTVYSHKSAKYTFIGAYYKESQQQYICQEEYKELNKHHKSCIKAFCNPAVGLVHQSINLHQKE